VRRYAPTALEERVAADTVSEVHPRISVSAISTMTWDIERDIEFWAETGITNVGVSMRKLDQFGIEKGVRRLREAGVRVSNVIGTGTSGIAAGIDVAAELGAECLVFTSGPAGRATWEQAAAALARTLAPIAGKARAVGVPLALEHTNSLRADVGFVHTLRDAVDLARMLDVGVCMEVNACWGERALGETIATGVDRIRLVQLSDYVVGTLSTPDRAVPGDGDIPLDRIVGQLLGAGYTGTFDLELIGPRIEAEGYERAVPRAVATVELLLARLEG
jgi:sugar phosphate isomerase/epimerase